MIQAYFERLEVHNQEFTQTLSEGTSTFKSCLKLQK